MPSTTTTLRSSEAVTKFLRSKEGDIFDILKLASDVLDQKLDVYFPNSRDFVLSLLVDRLNDRSNSSKFGEWKYNKEVWSLLEKVLQVKDRNQSDASILQNLKIIDLVILLMDSNDPQGWSCLPSVCHILSTFMQKLFIEIDEYTGIRLLKSSLKYTENRTLSDPSTSLDEIVTRLYWNSSSQGVLDVSKKSYTLFFEDLFHPLTKHLSTSSELSTKHLYEEVFTKRIFNPANLQYLSHNLEKLLKKETIDDASLKYFFQKAVQKLASKNMKLCTEVFNVIVNKFPHLAELLLALLVSSQHTMPQEFISSVYAKEVASKKFIDLNWDMVKYVFELDSELAATKSKFVFEKYNSAFKLNEKVLPVGKVVVSAYTKNRELVDFLIKVWPKAVGKDELWDGEEFVAHVAHCVSFLSEKQITQVVEASPRLLTEASAAILTAITKGLMPASPKMVESLKPSFHQIQDFINASSNFWQIRYNLLNLYGTDFVVPESLLRLDYDIYYHYTMFRLLELSVVKCYSEKQQRQFILFLRDNSNLAPLVFYRWFVIVNEFFSGENIIELLKVALETNFLENIDEEFFEQRNIMSCMTRIFIGDPLFSLKYITSVPLVCYSRGPKKDLLNTLTKIYIESRTEGVLHCINYLLESSSYQSNIERDFSILVQLLGLATTGEAQRYAISISKKVWKSNIDMIKSDANRIYVENAIDTLLKHMSKDNGADITPQMKMTLIVISYPSAPAGEILVKYEKLVHTFKGHCIKQIKIFQDFKEDSKLIWLLCGVANIPRSMLNFKDVLSITKLFQGQSYNDSLMQAIFSLVCKTAQPDLRFAKFVLGLFLVLDTKASSQILYDDIVEYLQMIANEKLDVYRTVCLYAIASTAETEKDFVNSTTKIVSAILTAMPKECDETLLVGLFANYLRMSLHLLLLEPVHHIVASIKWLLTQKPWLFNQYVLEMAIAFVGDVQKTVRSTEKDEFEELYSQSTQAVSQMLLHHRFKLSTRHHLIINLMCTFLKKLVEPEQLGHSTTAANSFTRLLSNLCEPQEHVRDVSTGMGQYNNRLTSQASLYKKLLRVHLPYLMINYIYLNLKFTFDKKVNDILVVGIYTIFDILSKRELQIVNSALDFTGKALYKSLYRDYQEYWKWKDQ